jgi:hypothetical protein
MYEIKFQLKGRQKWQKKTIEPIPTSRIFYFLFHATRLNAKFWVNRFWVRAEVLGCLTASSDTGLWATVYVGSS